MTKPLRQFWQTLDELPGAATDRRDWMARLGGEFPGAVRYLRKTGRRATAIDCPSPGGEGCPRAVIRNAAGAFRAVCRSATGRCDPVDLDPADLDILELDAARLHQDLATAFAVQTATGQSRVGRVVHLGEHGVAAGVGAPVLLVLPGPEQSLGDEDLRLGGLGAERSVVLAPTAASLPASMRARLSERGHQVLALADITTADAAAGLSLLQPVGVLLRETQAALQARLGATSGDPRIALPPDARWEELTFVLVSDEVLNISFRGQTHRVEPDRLGMKDARSGKATDAWGFLRVLARTGGTLGPLNRELVEEHKKHKQTLTRKLVEAFGISAEPVLWDRKTRVYQTAFVIRDDRPKAVRLGGARR